MKKTLAVFVAVCILVTAGCSKQVNQETVSEQVETEAKTEAVIETKGEAETQETTIEPLSLPEESMDQPPPEDEKRKIIIATDIHYLARELTDQGKGFEYMVEHGDGKLAGYVWEIVDAFIDQVIQENPEILVLSGDLSLDGERLSHVELAEKLQKIEDAGIPIVVIPGNHDINCISASGYKGNVRYPAEPTSPAQFAQIYEAYGYDEALSRDPNSLSYLYQLDDMTQLLMLDSCQYDSGRAKVGGMIKTETYEWMEEILETAWAEGINLIPVAHHNLLDESQVYVDDCTIEHAEDLEEILADWGVMLFFSGHLHVQHFKTSEEFGIDEVVTSSLSTAPCQYGILEYSDDGSFEYRTKKVEVEAWAERTGSKDKNLLNFDLYGTEMLERVFYNEAYEDLKNREINKKDKSLMAALYARLNSYATAGMALEIREEIMADPAYQMWQERDGSSISYLYMEEMLRDAVWNYNSFRRE